MRVERKGEKCCPFQLESRDPAVEEERRAKEEPVVRASRHFFFHFKHWTMDIKEIG